MSEKQRKIIWYILLGVCAVIMLIVLLGAATTMYNNASFSPINGDYQTYNIVRRMRAGQLPFRDYVNYLGIGVTQLVGAVAMLLGNTLVASKTAVSLLYYFALWIEIAVLLYLITRRKLAALGGATVLFCFSVYAHVVQSAQPGLGGLLQQDLFFADLLTANNSLRPLRASLPFFVGAALLLIFRYYRPKRQGVLRPYYVAALLAMIAACARLWTNDMGLVFVLVSFVVFAVFRARWQRQYAIELGVWLGVYLVMHFITVMLATGGHYGAWWTYNSVFGGVSDYQTWYYMSAGNRIFTWPELFRAIISQSWSQWLVLLYSTYLLVRTRSTGPALRFRKACTEYCLAVIGFTITFANWVYYVKSCAMFPYLGVLHVYAACLLFGYGGIALRKLCARRVSQKAASVTLCIVLLILTAGVGVTAVLDTAQKFASIQPRTENYSEVLGGNNENLQQITSYVDKVGDSTVFSTYATALEDIRGGFQPSKADYVIHALGDTAREEYLQAYHDANADFVATINPKVSAWEYWCMRANWFFYREMLAEYQPIDTEGYLLLWEKADVQQPNAADYMAVIDAGTIHVTSQNAKEASVVDLRIEYTTSFNGKLMRLLSLNSEVSVSDAWTYSMMDAHSVGAPLTYSLPSGKQTVNIPVYVDETGYGSVSLTSYPYQRSGVTITSAQVENAYVDPTIFPPQ